MAKQKNKDTQKAFKRGDVVKWESTSGGVTTQKKGTVVKVVQPEIPVLTYFRPSELNQQLRIKQGKYNLSKLGSGSGYVRENRSYLVEVCNGKSRKPYLYFPKAKNLRCT